MKKIAPVLAWTCLLAGCAHVPDATIAYRLATTELRFRVLRTVACDKDNRPIIATAVSPAIRHVADDTAQYFFPLSGIQGVFSDTDTRFDFYDDRRIKGINASSAGAGAPVLKTALSIAASGAAFRGGSVADACASVAAAGNQKPLTLIYEGEVRTNLSGPQIIAPEPATAPYANDDKIKSLVHAICAVVEDAKAQLIPVISAPDTPAFITAREPGLALIRIAVSPDDVECGAAALWHDRLPVAQLGRMYRLPVPRAALFGKQAFAASFAESGALTQVQYAASGGAAAAMTALDSVAASNADSAARQAADLKAQADLIFQQQRLVACRADAARCN